MTSINLPSPNSAYAVARYSLSLSVSISVHGVSENPQKFYILPKPWSSFHLIWLSSSSYSSYSQHPITSFQYLLVICRKPRQPRFPKSWSAENDIIFLVLGSNCLTFLIVYSRHPLCFNLSPFFL